MKKEKHVQGIEDALSWLVRYDYIVWKAEEKFSDPIFYNAMKRKFNLEEDYRFVIIASDNVLELATNSDADVIQFVNDMIDCYNELQEEVRAYESTI